MLNSNEDEDKMMRATSVHGHTKGDKQYIVKKPINMVEFNWKTFEHQAFVQQHFAQQNLQAYLTSVNHFSGQPNAGQAMPSNEQLLGNYQMGEDVSNSNGSNRGEYLPQGSNATAATAVNGAAAPAASQDSSFSNDGALGVLSRAAAASTESTATAFVARNGSGSASGSTPAPQPLMGVLGSFSLPTDKNPSDILFNNGTHNMINNISTWTTNSVNEMGQQEGVPAPGGANGGTTGSAGPRMESGTLPLAMQNSTGSGIPAPPPGMFGPSVTANGAVLSFANGTSGGVDTPGSAQQHPAEEFWTMNDDYGFLT